MRSESKYLSLRFYPHQRLTLLYIKLYIYIWYINDIYKVYIKKYIDRKANRWNIHTNTIRMPYIHIHIYICMYTCVCIYKYICIYLSIYIYIYTYIYIYIYINKNMEEECGFQKHKQVCSNPNKSRRE